MSTQKRALGSASAEAITFASPVASIRPSPNLMKALTMQLLYIGGGLAGACVRRDCRPQRVRFPVMSATRLQLPHTPGCLVCGRNNDFGLKLSLFVEPSTGVVSVDFA